MLKSQEMLEMTLQQSIWGFTKWHVKEKLGKNRIDHSVVFVVLGRWEGCRDFLVAFLRTLRIAFGDSTTYWLGCCV